jgi:hypothetical protein
MPLEPEDGLTPPVSDLRPGAVRSCEVTLSSSAGTVTVVTLPSTARGVRLFPRTNHVRFSLDHAPVAVGTDTTTAVAVAKLTQGGVAKADQWTTRSLPGDRVAHTLQLRSTTASVVVDIEVW